MTMLLTTTATFAQYEEDVKNRLQPIGKVCMQGDPCAASAVATVSSTRDGLTVYNQGCLACHTTGAGGAPLIGDAGVWAERLTKGLDTLYNHAFNGFNTMPAKGVCSDCSMDEIKLAVDYIIEQSQ